VAVSDYVRGLRAAQELAERQASESHNDSWNREVAAVVQAIADEVEEADAYAQAWK